MDFTDLLLDGTSQFPIESVTSITNGALEIIEFTPDLSNLATVENTSLLGISGGVIDLASISALTLGSNEIRSDGENSTVSLPALTQLTSLESKVFLFSATNGGTIELASPNLNGGDLFTSTTGTISGTTITAASGSLLRGPGTLSSSLTNQATIKLDKDTAPVIVDGNVILDTDSRVEVTVGLGTEKTGTGKLEITGATTLGGTLEVIKRGSYNPVVGDEFEIMTFDSKSGDFALLTGLALSDGFAAEVEVSDQK